MSRGAFVSPKSVPKRHLSFLKLGTNEPPEVVPRIMLIERIAAIGAIYDKEHGLGIHDRAWISRTFEFFAATNLATSKNVQITPWDLANGHDILDPGSFPHGTDAWILCWVWNPRSLEHLNMDPDPNKQSSPRHFENAVWYAAARRAGVKIIVTFSNVCAADGHRIGPRDYKTEIDSRAFVGADYIKGPDYEFDEALNAAKLKVVRETIFRRDWAKELSSSDFCSPMLRAYLEWALSENSSTS